MKAFHFRLEKLLEHRSGIAEQAKGQLATKVGEINRLQAVITEARSNQHEQFMVHREVFDINLLRMSEFYGLRQQSIITQAQQRLLTCDRQKEALLVVYREKLKEQLILERLKERYYADYKKEKLRHEVKILDDIVASVTHNQGGE
jgi:flagellar FliJ protein